MTDFCPGCHHYKDKHVGGACYDCSARNGFCGWRYLGEGNVWGVPRGWWHWLDLPEGKSTTIVPEQVEWQWDEEVNR